MLQQKRGVVRWAYELVQWVVNEKQKHTYGKYQREPVVASALARPYKRYTLCYMRYTLFSPSVPWASILHTKDLSALFDQYMHFHHSAIFCFYSKASGYKRAVVQSTVFNNILVLSQRPVANAVLSVTPYVVENIYQVEWPNSKLLLGF